MDVPRERRPRRLRRLVVAVMLFALAGSGAAIARLRPAAPAVERAGLLVSEVRRGEMLRTVQGWGALVPERIRWVTAVDPGRIERIDVRPGQSVDETSIVVVVTNPEIELHALESERQKAAAQGDLVALEASALRDETERQAALLTLRGSLDTASARATADDDLAARGFLGALERAVSGTERSTLAARTSLEEKRAGVLAETSRRRIESQRHQIEQLDRMAGFRRRQLAALQVRAGAAGVVQEIAVELGQWVTPGTLIAKVADPRALKAVVKIQEGVARDVAVGQTAAIDTQIGIVAARVARVAPKVHEGTVAVDLTIAGALPAGARPDLAVVGTIELERLRDVLHVERPHGAQPGAGLRLFRLSASGEEATRIDVRLGPLSATHAQVTMGVRPGDRVIVSDTSAFVAAERIRLQ